MGSKWPFWVLTLTQLTAVVNVQGPVTHEMPHIMNLKLISRQFVVEEGDAQLMPTEDGRPVSFDTPRTAKIRNNVIEGISIERTGEANVMIMNGIVRLISGGSPRLIPLFAFPAAISRDDLQKGDAEIPIGPAAFVRIRVRNRNGGVPSPPSIVGLVGVEPGTIEGPVNEVGEADFLLRIGKYTAYIAGVYPRKETTIVVIDGNPDAGIVELRVP